jgi:uncharacterized protein TP_0846
MTDRKGHLQIDILGASFSLDAGESDDYLQSIYSHYAKVVADVQKTSGVTEPIRVAIIAGLLLSDELSKERLNPQVSVPEREAEALIEQSTRKMIEDIDSIIYSLAPQQLQ